MTDDGVRVRGERTDRWRRSWTEFGASRWAGPSGHAAIAAQEPAEAFVDHHLAATGGLDCWRCVFRRHDRDDRLIHCDRYPNGCGRSERSCRSVRILRRASSRPNRAPGGRRLTEIQHRAG
jgi:hypothetical protein